jgi:hypothetical protein
MDYESTALVVSVVQKSSNINTPKHLNPALGCPEWTGIDRNGPELGTF